MALDLVSILISIIVNVIIIAPSLWLAGRALVGGKKARFLDSIWIVVAGTVIGQIIGYFFTGWIAVLVQLVVWLGLVKHFFDATWVKALVISILAIIIFIVVITVLGILGFAVFGLFQSAALF